MSVVRAQELLQKVANDVVFRQSLENAADTSAKRQILDDAGFADVTKEHIEQATAQGATELSDAELEAVAGGATSQWWGISITVIVMCAIG